MHLISLCIHHYTSNMPWYREVRRYRLAYDLVHKSETNLFLLLNTHFTPLGVKIYHQAEDNITFKISLSFQQFVEKCVLSSTNIQVCDLYPKSYTVRSHPTLCYTPLHITCLCYKSNRMVHNFLLLLVFANTHQDYEYIFTYHICIYLI